jgi:dihydroorotase
MAAAYGGITFIADMPNVIPPTSSVERFIEKVKIAGEKSYIDFGILTLLTDTNLSEMAELKKQGVLGFKVFLGTSTGDLKSPSPAVLYEQMEESKLLGLRIGFHAENSELNAYFTSLCMKKTDVPENILLSEARPVISEVSAIQNAVCFAQYTGAKIHIHHITSLDGALLVIEAKKKGISITAETCPHYLLLDTSHKNTYKVYPPVRDESHRKFLWEALYTGAIDMIASDHAPHTAEEKEQPVWEAPAGLTGTETFVPLMLNVINRDRDKKFTLNDFVRLASEEPAKIWGIYPKKGCLLPGADADFTIVDMNQKSIINKDSLHSKSKTCVYHGMEIQGKPVATIVRGCFIMKDGVLTGKKGFGILVSPEH